MRQTIEISLRPATEGGHAVSATYGHANVGSAKPLALRIAFYSPRASYLDSGRLLVHGGDPVFLGALISVLRARGHELRIVSGLDVRDLWLGRVPPYRLLTEALAIRKMIRRFSPDGWLVFQPCRTYPDLFGWWQRPKRYVLLAAHTWQSKRLPPPWRLLLAAAHYRSLRRADRVLAVCPSIAHRLHRRGVPKDRLSLMPYGVKVPPSIPVQAEARSYLDLPQDISVIFCATRFTEVGNSEGKTEMLVNLLRAFAEVPTKSLLVLVGDGPGRGHIERNILEQGLETRVRLLGAVENDAMKWFYAACDLYAYPHWLDRPWMSVLEAQAHGRPVVSMRTGSAEITVVDGRTGLLANSSDEFREHLAELTADRARCRAMGKEAQDYISKVHSIHVRVRQIEELMSQQPHSQTARGLGRLLTFNRTAR